MTHVLTALSPYWTLSTLLQLLGTGTGEDRREKLAKLSGKMSVLLYYWKAIDPSE